MASMSRLGGRFLRATIVQSSPFRVPILYTSTTTTSDQTRQSKTNTYVNGQRTETPTSQTVYRNSRKINTRDRNSILKILQNREDVGASMQLPKKLNLDETAQLVIQVSELVKAAAEPLLTEEELHTLLNDQSFERLSNTLHEVVHRIPLSSLLSCVQSLLKMSPEDLFLTKSVETQIIWLLRSMSIGNIMKVLAIHKEHQETALRRQVLQQCVEQLTGRWIEIKEPHDLLTLMHTVGDIHTKLLLKVEERAMDLCEIMTEMDLYQMVLVLSRKKRRNKPLLSKLAYFLSKSDFNLSLNEVQNLLFSCSDLQIFDEKLLKKITEVLLAESSKIENPKKCTDLLYSVSNLRWRHEGLLDTLCGAILEDIDAAKTRDLLGVILTCAHLDYLPRKVSSKWEEMIDRLSSVREENERKWLDAVWSCAVLRCARPDMVASVLDKEFLNNFQGAAEIVNVKLRNLASVARFEVDGYRGPHLEDASVQVPVRSNRPVLESVIKALTSLAPADKYLRFDVAHPSGFNIDIELTVKSNRKPMPKNSAPDSGSYRIAIKVLDFADMTLNSVRPTGLHAMAKRHLEYHGYQVVEVPYSEFQELSTEVQRVQYLENKIASVIKSKGSKS